MSIFEMALAGALGVVALHSLVLWRDHKETRRRAVKLRKALEGFVVGLRALELDKNTRLATVHELHAEMAKMRETIPDRPAFEKLVERMNVFAKDLMATKDLVANLSRQANAIGMKRVGSGVLPAPPKEE